MKKFLFTLVLLMITSPAFGTTITFDPFPSIPSDVTVQYFDGGLSGTLSALPTTNSEALTSASSAIPSGGSALLLYSSTLTFGPYGALFTFDTFQSSVSMVGNDFGGDSVNDNEVVYLTAFDSMGNVIGGSTFESDFDEPNLKPITFTSSSADIKYIAFTWLTDLGYYALDNVEYTSSAVPEPATMLLLGFGLIGLAGLRKRFIV